MLETHREAVVGIGGGNGDVFAYRAVHGERVFSGVFGAVQAEVKQREFELAQQRHRALVVFRGDKFGVELIRQRLARLEMAGHEA